MGPNDRTIYLGKCIDKNENIKEKKKSSIFDINAIISNSNRIAKKKEKFIENNNRKKITFLKIEESAINRINLDIAPLNLFFKRCRNTNSYYMTDIEENFSRLLSKIVIEFVVTGQRDEETEVFVCENLKLKLETPPHETLYDDIESLVEDEEFIHSLKRNHLIVTGIIK